MLGLGPIAGISLASVQAGGIAPPATVTYGDRIGTVQELPWHPKPYFWPKHYQTNVGVPSIAHRIVTRQEQPYHPAPYVQIAQQGPDVFPQPIKNTILIVQEVPYHPPSQLGAPKPFQNVIPATITALRTRQEYPLDHPRGRISAGVYTDILRVPTFIFKRQEQPPQYLWPRPPMHSGFATPRERTYGFVIH